jgi:hypothetical protein
MSIEAMALVLHHSKASGAAKLVLLGIANHQSDSGAWPAVATLGKYAAVSDRRVQQIIRELEASGELLTNVQAGGRGQYKTNLYWVNVSCPVDCDGSSNHRSGVKSGASRGEIWSHSGVKPVSPEPLDKPLEEPHDQNKFDRSTILDEFKTFWDVYPRRVGKGAALKAFAKALNDAPASLIVEGAKRYADDPNRSPAFTAHPSTWLNAARWDDEPLPERKKSPEEVAEAMRAKREQDRLRAIADSKAAFEEAERRRKEIELNPPKRCHHDRVAIICSECLRENRRGAQ